MVLEPTRAPDAAPVPSFSLGRDRAGHWVVRDAAGLTGGLFATRRDAEHHLRLEWAGHPYVVEAVDGIEKNLDEAPRSSPGRSY